MTLLLKFAEGNMKHFIFKKVTLPLLLACGLFASCDSGSPNQSQFERDQNGAFIADFTPQEVQALAQKMISPQQTTLSISQVSEGLLEIVDWNAEIKMQSSTGMKDYKLTYTHQQLGQASMDQDQLIGQYYPLESVPGYSDQLHFKIPLQVDLSQLEAGEKSPNATISLKEAPQDKKLVIQKIEFDVEVHTYLSQFKLACEQKTQLGQIFYWCPLSSSQAQTNDTRSDSPSRSAFFATLSSQNNDSYTVNVFFGLESLDGLSKSGTSTLALNYKRKK